MISLRPICGIALIFCCGIPAFSDDTSDANWPQAAGPHQNWTVTTDHAVPLKWSVEKNENIRWRVTLPETGQSGIAVWEDRLFLTTMKPM